MKKPAWLQSLLLSGLALGLPKFAEATDGHENPLMLFAIAGTVAVEVFGHFLIHVAHGQREEAARHEHAARNHQVRRGMAAAMRRALSRAPKPRNDLYAALTTSWDESLKLALENDDALELFFPAEQFAESHWCATNPYSPNPDQDSEALAAVLREWLIRDRKLYDRWPPSEALTFARGALPFYQEEFAADLTEPDGLLSQAFTVKGINEIRAFTLRALPLLQQIAATQGDKHAEVMQALRELLNRTQSRRELFLSNIPARLKRPFVGRNGDLDGIERKLGPPSKESVLVLHGAPGTGKSELAREFARSHPERYPGGTFIVNASTLDVEFARIGATILRLVFPPDLRVPDQARQTFYSLGADPFLLIYDNVAALEAIADWLPRAGWPCHVLITTVLDRWAPEFELHEVKKLSPSASLRLFEEICGPDTAGRYGKELAEFAGGLPVEICPLAAALVILERRGHPEDIQPHLVPEAEGSFRAAYELLDVPARLLLHAAAILEPQAIPLEELCLHLEKASQWNRDKVKRHLDDCIGVHMIEGTKEFTIHQRIAGFLCGEERNFVDADSLKRVREVQGRRLREAAGRVVENPADSRWAKTLLLFPQSPQVWERAGIMIPPDDGSVVGRSLYEIGHFAEAQPWFERAVRETQEGDVHGRVDHESLGSSLHQVGDCLSSTGHFAEAQPWFERAVREKQEGDVHGRVDHASLGRSLHQVGYCLASTGHFAEAQPWFERAVREKQEGDVHGRVDHESLGSSLHQVGDCLSSTGHFAEAQPWFERAVREKQEGDVHGRVDHASLGSSLHLVGDCLSRTGHSAEAQLWFERAVEEAGKGDVHGRVDHVSLGISLHLLGYCLSSTGRFAEAQPWFEKAVEETGKGDVHGRVDHASLGRSLHQVGYCLASTGHFAEAQPWFEKAVEETGKGDVHGRVDHASLGRSLHQVGYCLASTGHFAEAQPWFERAVEEAGKGDVHGRVDHASLGSSLHQVGDCLASTGHFAEAQPWFERAVEEAGKGDVHGRVDHASLGRSLHLVGYCLASTGHFAEAQPWFERAVEEAGKGDVHGRVDHASLGRSLHQVGDCLARTGHSAEAQPWFEKAVEEAGKGDVHGRVDYASLGRSLHQVGYCLARTGHFAEAQPWFERAVEEAGKGDVHGRVDHASLGISLHQVGYCLARTGHFAEAQPWFERAVEEAGKGDVHGRVDHASLGISLHQVGYCLSRTGHFAEAQPWFERAVEEAGKGDVHGRVDHESLGSSLHQVGDCLSRTGHSAEAQLWFERAREEAGKGDVR